MLTFPISPFFFKRLNPTTGIIQIPIILDDVTTPHTLVTTDIIGLYNLEDDKTNTDPNTLALYGTWTAAAGTFVDHLGVLADNGFGKYLSGAGLQKNGWGSGTLDTYYNTDGMTFSWIARISNRTATNRVMQYWQADNERIELFLQTDTTMRLAVQLGTGTELTSDVLMSTYHIDDNGFHHFIITFDPTGERIARLYIDNVLAASVGPITGTSVFGDEATNIRRGISFGSVYSDATVGVAGDVDCITILKGVFSPSTVPATAILYSGDPVTYNSDIITYAG